MMLARSAMVRASSDWPVEWSKAAPDTIKPNVFKRYLVSLRQVRPYLDHLYLDNIDRKVMAKVANRKGVSNATRRRDLTAVSSNCLLRAGGLTDGRFFVLRYPGALGAEIALCGAVAVVGGPKFATLRPVTPFFDRQLGRDKGR